MARATLKNNVRLGTSGQEFEDMRKLTDEEIEDRISWERTKRERRRQAESKLLQELENEK